MCEFNLLKHSENYFNTLNPLAERISVDIKSIKDIYEDLWEKLSDEERRQIIDDTLISPQAVFKYSSTLPPPQNKYQIEDIETDNKYIVDESTGVCWRDEHSAPFTWKTVSQLNLHLFANNSDTGKTGNNTIGKPADKKPIFHELKQMNNDLKKNFQVELENVLRNGHNFEKEDTPDAPHLVLGGNAAGKGFKTKLIARNIIASNQNLFMKLKTNTVSKIQNSIKSVSSKNVTSLEKQNGINESETLIQQQHLPVIITTTTRVPKVSPKHVSKPKSPPPPPPPLKNERLRKKEAPKIISKQINNDCNINEKSSLLRNSKTEDDIFCKKKICKKELSIDTASSTSESVGLSSQSTKESGLNVSRSDSFGDNHHDDGDDILVPKSGFDFLDNW